MRTAAPALKVIRGSLAGIAPVDSGTLGQRVYNGLRDFLMAGQLQPGE
jgi:DNA-binding GntR family transcriptional regulator